MLPDLCIFSAKTVFYSVAYLDSVSLCKCYVYSKAAGSLNFELPENCHEYNLHCMPKVKNHAREQVIRDLCNV